MPSGNRIQVTLDVGEGLNPFRRTASGRSKTRAFTKLAESIIGSGIKDRRTYRPRIIAGKVRASGTLALSTASGAVGGVINGVTVTATWATSDINSASLVAAAINASADALVKDLVEACNLAATFTLATTLAGDSVSILGYTFTAQPSATLRYDEFNQSGTDTADAASLVTQINAREGLNQLVWASSSAGVVTVRQIAGTTAKGVLAKSGAAITLSGQLAATATVLVTSYRPGVAGNCITLAASGTGVTASVARLAGGTEDKFTY